MDTSSPAPQWATLPQDAQDDSGDSAAEFQGEPDRNIRPKSKARPSLASKRTRDHQPSESLARPPKRQKQGAEEGSSGPGNTGNIASSSTAGARLGPSIQAIAKPPTSRSVTERVHQLFRDQPRMGKAPHASMPHLASSAVAGSSRNGGSSKNPIKEPKSSSGEVEDDDDDDMTSSPPTARQVATKSTGRHPPPPPKKPEPGSPAHTVISIGSSDEEPRPRPPSKGKAGTSASSRKIKVSVPDSPKKLTQLPVESASAPVQGNSWKSFAESLHKGHDESTNVASSSKLPASVAGPPKKGKVAPSIFKAGNHTKQSHTKTPSSKLDSFFPRKGKTLGANADGVDRRPLGEALGIESPKSVSRASSPTTRKVVKEQPGPSKAPKKFTPAKNTSVPSGGNLASAIQEAAAQNSRSSTRPRKPKAPTLRASLPAGPSSGVSVNTAIDLTSSTDEDENPSNPPPLPQRNPPITSAVKPEPVTTPTKVSSVFKPAQPNGTTTVPRRLPEPPATVLKPIVPSPLPSRPVGGTSVALPERPPSQAGGSNSLPSRPEGGTSAALPERPPSQAGGSTTLPPRPQSRPSASATQEPLAPPKTFIDAKKNVSTALPLTTPQKSDSVRSGASTTPTIAVQPTNAESTPQVLKKHTSAALPQRPGRLAKSPAVRRHTMPVVPGTAESTSDEDNGRAAPLTRIAMPAAVTSAPTSAPPASPITVCSSDSSRAPSPGIPDSVPQIPAFRDPVLQQPIPISSQMDTAARTIAVAVDSTGPGTLTDSALSLSQQLFPDDEDSDVGYHSDTDVAMEEVDALLSATRNVSSELDDITEALGTQKLKTSSPDEPEVVPNSQPRESPPSYPTSRSHSNSRHSRAKSQASVPSSVVDEPLADTAPEGDDDFADFYASESENAADLPMIAPQAATSVPVPLVVGASSITSSTSADSSPCHTPPDTADVIQPTLLKTPLKGEMSFGGFIGYSFDDWREQYEVKVKYAKDLPSRLHDHINSYTEAFRRSDDMRAVLQASIAYNTMEDEPHAPRIEIINDVDDEATPPWEFFYSNDLWHGEGVPDPDTLNLVGCDCIGKCDPKSKTCSCVAKQRVWTKDDVEVNGGFAYDKHKRLKIKGRPIFECNAKCGCDADCMNRVVQHGRTVQISIKKTEKKGWGVFAGPKKIPSGTFLGIYSGEVLTVDESHRRGRVYDETDRTYLFDLDFYFIQEVGDIKYTMDAYHAGNFTRFLNHSCEPNCKINPCFINEANLDKPLLVLFSHRDIEPFHEICFNYAGLDPLDDQEDEEDEAPSTMVVGPQRNNAIYRRCECGTKSCTGEMF